MSSLSEEALPFFSLSQSISLLVCRCWNMAVLVCPWKSWVWCWESLWTITLYAWLMCLPCRSQERWVKNATRGVRLTKSDLSFYVYLSIYFPFNISLVLRRVLTLYGEKLFFLFNWSLFQSRSYNCTPIGSCRIKKMNQSTAVAREPMVVLIRIYQGTEVTIVTVLYIYIYIYFFLR